MGYHSFTHCWQGSLRSEAVSGMEGCELLVRVQLRTCCITYLHAQGRVLRNTRASAQGAHHSAAHNREKLETNLKYLWTGKELSETWCPTAENPTQPWHERPEYKIVWKKKGDLFLPYCGGGAIFCLFVSVFLRIFKHMHALICHIFRTYNLLKRKPFSKWGPIS